MDKLKKAKSELRRDVIAKRDALSEGSRAEASRLILARLHNLPVMQTARSIFVFVSYASEVDTHPLIDQLLEIGREIAVPKIVDKTTMLAVPIKGWEDLQPDRLGILSPIAATASDGPFDVVITPGVAFTETGQRLGYGRGYYDRWFSQHPSAGKVALTFEAQIVPELPTGEYDLPVDLIVTEKRLIRPHRKLD
ncbi:MAG: 5-formyltetrahydrofolate cyclo-ligase [Gammaproteobacteria bacterium]